MTYVKLNRLTCLIELLLIHSNTWNHLTMTYKIELFEIELFGNK